MKGLKMNETRTSLAVQWLRLCTSNSRAVDSIPGQKAKIPHASRPRNQNIKQKQYCNKFDKDFTKKMNELSQKAGAMDSRFKNPHGLPQDGHYTTARDLSLITCYAYQNPVFREIVATKYYEKQHWKKKNL